MTDQQALYWASALALSAVRKGRPHDEVLSICREVDRIERGLPFSRVDNALAWDVSFLVSAEAPCPGMVETSLRSILGLLPVMA